MNKNKFAPKPPMGWNSYDYYDTSVNEDNIKANATYMAKHLKAYGYDTLVVDIEWYAKNVGTKRDLYQYIPFEEVVMDPYGRLLPDPERFPSAIGGNGFKPLADFVHTLGLKFGIHIMRGLPRAAAHQHLPIMGSPYKASDIADPSSICFWNPDMYGLRASHEGSGAYYDSLLDLYASWGVDFIKCDDICRMDMPSAKEEIRLLHEAIIKSGREIVLSLSPGAALLSEAWTYEKYANMWRITDDFWDHWPLLLDMFDRCEKWQNHVKPGSYPDCDMLPIGKVGKGFGHERTSNFTEDELKTMMGLWSIFRSPLMIGGELTLMTPSDLTLLTNPYLLRIHSYGSHARQVFRSPDYCLWYSKDQLNEDLYMGVFNLSDHKKTIHLGPEILDLTTWTTYHMKEAWSDSSLESTGNEQLELTLPAHGSLIITLSPR